MLPARQKGKGRPNGVGRERLIQAGLILLSESQLSIFNRMRTQRRQRPSRGILLRSLRSFVANLP